MTAHNTIVYTSILLCISICCKLVVCQLCVIIPPVLIVLFFHALSCLDSEDEFVSHLPKKSGKKSLFKKDAIESVFDNDIDEYLDAISTKGGSTPSDTMTGNKNGPAGLPDDAPVDMVSEGVYVVCTHNLYVSCMQVSVIITITF